MKFLVGVVFLAVVGFGACADKPSSCYESVLNACLHPGKSELDHCNAKYGAMKDVTENIEEDLQKFVTTHIAHSFDHLLMSTYFGNYQADRPGFRNLFRKLSDSTWDDAIDLIKFVTKRGGMMDFNTVSKAASTSPMAYEMEEAKSLARALDSQKMLATEAQRIHGQASRHREAFHDPEVSSFIENHFVHKHSDSIRDLSGHNNDLRRLIQNNQNTDLSLFLFDEYLQKL